MVEISLFGGVSASDDGGHALDVGPTKCQTVLAVLALSPESAVPISRLVELVWAGEPPRTAEKTLQTYIARLRKGLGADAIARSGASYRLDIAPEHIDIVRFQRAISAGDIPAALAEWNGTPFAGVDAEGLTPIIDSLVEEWLGAVETDLGHRVESDPAATIGELTELTSAYPFREGLWAVLMTALYRAGRQADALAAYRTARGHLVESLGVEPGPQLRQLEAMILGQDELLQLTERPAATSVGPPSGTVTFGFVDIEDGATLWISDRHAMRTAVERYESLVRSTAAEHDGHVFAVAGDSFGVAFHRASEARRWAEELHRSLAMGADDGGLELGIRVGLHSGEAEEKAGDYFGSSVNFAAMLASLGHGGQTLVSGATAAMLDAAEVIGLGTARVAGVSTDQQVFQLGLEAYPPLRGGVSGGNLPQRSGRLIGRDEELASIASALERSSVVTLVGPGGIGKTRLALAAGRIAEASATGERGADVVWLVELATVASSDDVPRAVAEAVGARDRKHRTHTKAIIDALSSRPTLLVLDNCEHVIEGAAELTARLVDQCPELRVLATSREGLGLAGELLIAVPPLDPTGPGVQLFNLHAAAADQHFDVDAAQVDVEEICRRLDGIPLAIELAAARARSLSPRDLVERLDDRLRLLTGGRRTSVERHRTLRATIQWSYELLTPAEQLLFRRLSIFAGPFDLPAAETVASDAASGIVGTTLPPGETEPAMVDDLIEGLVARSMVIVESGPFGRRFRLLETMRQFAAEHLAEDGETDLVASRHCQWTLERVNAIGVLLGGRAELEGVARLDELQANLRAAFEWACATGDAALARSLVEPIATEVSLRNRSEIGDWAERILEIARPDDMETLVPALSWAANRYMFNQDRQAFEELIQRYGEPDHPRIRFARAEVYDDDEQLLIHGSEIVATLRDLGRHHQANLYEFAGVAGPMMATGQFEAHDELARAFVEKYRTSGPPTFLHWALFMLGFSASFQGRHDEADQYFDQSARVDVPPATISMNPLIEARSAMLRGNADDAFRLLRNHIDESLATDSMMMSRLTSTEFVNMMTTIDRLPDAAHLLGHLERSGGFGELSAATVVAEAARRVDADPELKAIRTEARERGDLDDRRALTYMADVLDELLATD